MASCKQCMSCLRKYREITSENLCVDIGDQRVNAETTTDLPWFPYKQESTWRVLEICCII